MTWQAQCCKLSGTTEQSHSMSLSHCRPLPSDEGTCQSFFAWADERCRHSSLRDGTAIPANRTMTWHAQCCKPSGITEQPHSISRSLGRSLSFEEGTCQSLLDWAEERCRHSSLRDGTAIPANRTIKHSHLDRCNESNGHENSQQPPRSGNGSEAQVNLRGGAELDKSLKQKGNKENMMPNIWTINCGGLSGFWRLLELLGGLARGKRPCIILAQEIMTGKEEWLCTLGRIDSLGYKGFCNGKISLGTKRRGVVTLVDATLRCNQLQELSTTLGSALAVKVGDSLVHNIYAPPRAADRCEFSTELEEWFQSIDWHGKGIIGGDFNEGPNDDWFQPLLEPRGYKFVPICNTDATRWAGSKTIDGFYSNRRNDCEAEALQDCLSDHKIIQMRFNQANESTTDYTFAKSHIFFRPSWMSPHQWKLTLQESLDHHGLRDWDMACHLADETFVEEQDTEVEQAMVDFVWHVTICRALVVYRTAYFLALLALTELEGNEEEAKRCTHLANHHLTDRLQKPKIQQRSYPRDGFNYSHDLRYKRNLYGRAQELLRRVRSGRADEATQNLWKKMGKHLASKDTKSLEHLTEVLRKDIELMEQERKVKSVRRWKYNVRTDFKARSRWLFRQKTSHFPSLSWQDSEPTETRQEALGVLHKFWDDLHEKVKWEDHEICSKATAVGEFLHGKLSQHKLVQERPSLKQFTKTLRDCSGAPGLDQWTTQEVKWLTDIGMAGFFWDAMKLWDQYETTPTILKDVKQVYVPKANKICAEQHVIEPKALRPIAVFSIWWRAYSSAWVRDDSLKPVKQCFKESMGSLIGSGTLAHAAVIDKMLNLWKHGCSLDYSHCFDTVNLTFLKMTLERAFTGIHRRWATTIVQHWMTSRRWIIYDKAVSPKFSVSDIGLPQGDGACPLMLGLLLAKGCDEVKMAVNSQPGSQLHQLIYMDDRTVVTNSKQSLNKAMEAWDHYTTKIHLLENPNKAQVVDLTSSQGPHSMEVLGVLVGGATLFDFSHWPKHAKRMEEARYAASRVALLPVRQHSKLLSLNMYAKAKAAYGWISGMPPSNEAKAFDAKVWKSAGRLTMGIPQLRTILAGAGIEISCTVLCKQLHALGHCTQATMDWKNDKQTRLEEMVYDHLYLLGWYKSGDCWQHTVLDFKFLLKEVCNRKDWQRIAHEVRQSHRWKAYNELHDLDRREIRDQQIPVFSLERIKLARMWAKQGEGSFPLAVGAVPSPAHRYTLWGQTSVCIKCGEHCPQWDHYWTCCLGYDPPDDILLRRFLWPRSRQELAISQRFCRAMELVVLQ